MCYQIEKSLEDAGDKVSAEEKAPITEQIAAVRQALSGSDIEAIKKAKEELQQRFYKIADKLYQQAQQAQGAAGAQAAGAQSDGTVEVNDYEVDADKKDDKKE